MNKGLINTINTRIIGLDWINYTSLCIIIFTMIYWLLNMKK